MVASTGILGALMAGAGLTGPTDIIDGGGAFERVVAGGIDTARLLAPLGGYKMMEVNTKWFNTVRTAQTAVTSMLSLLEQHRLDWRDVEAVTLFLPTKEHVGHDGIWNSIARLRPQNRDSANHSLVYSLAVAMVDRELGPEQYTEAKLRDPKVLSVVDRITLQSDATLDQYWPEAAVSRVALLTKNGQSCGATTLYPPGHHKNPVDDALMQQKFIKLTSPVLGNEKQAAIIRAVQQLEDLESVNELTRQLAAE
jgi:2-methylcitrate dehydratase